MRLGKKMSRRARWERRKSTAGSGVDMRPRGRSEKYVKLRRDRKIERVSAAIAASAATGDL